MSLNGQPQFLSSSNLSKARVDEEPSQFYVAIQPALRAPLDIHTREAFRRRLSYSTLMGSKAKALEVVSSGRLDTT